MTEELEKQAPESQDQKPEIPDRLWTKADIAEYLGYKPAMVNRIICKKDFPKSVRFGVEKGSIGHPRWFQDEVRAWAKAQRRRVA